MKRYAAAISTAVVLFCIWMFLTLSFHPHELVLGLGVSLIIAVATHGAFTSIIPATISRYDAIFHILPPTFHT